NNQLRQVMLSPRELVIDKIPVKVKTWVNRNLQYTHGYGVAMTPVNLVTSEGLPDLLIKDIPPVSKIDLTVTRPEIYFGELTNNYIFVRTRTPEFDYPKGDENMYTSYEGKGGVHVSSFVRRLAFATKFFDINILLSTYITGKSRIMLNRNIKQRVRTIAPFLIYDNDPYIVISDEGRLYWIIDAYTITDRFPYSELYPGKRINYIRNSVKIIIDAYSGSVDFYLIDTTDPIVKSYSRIFPELFKSFDEIPADLKSHLRYPRDLFSIQADMYRSYHMVDVRVFYNQEDLWETPSEVYSDNRQPMEPYYIIVKLLDEPKEEFLLMLPFTPSKKDNMIAWMAARSDPEVYGEILVYKLPKEKLIFGPMQIEARIDQQTEISRELTLWGQRGSRVIRGNLLVIPIGESFIYIEPVYLEARQEAEDFGGVERPTGFQRRRGAAGVLRPESQSAALPELKMVIASYGNYLTMREDLNTALAEIFGKIPPAIAEEKPAIRAPAFIFPEKLQELVESARNHYQRARQSLKEENWSAFGREWKQLENILTELENRTKSGKK
ncbi:MAG: UPF0182 family protein, partial [Fidelibacterota bacterium]